MALKISMRPGAVLIGLSLSAISAPAAAQNVSLDPSFGTVTLSGGFTPDPYTVELLSGGSVDAGTISSDCDGNIANAPDVRLVYDGGSLPLTISATSDEDTTLVVNGPDGSWYCDDDGGGGLDPSVHFDNPRSGRYEIWVGTYGSSGMQDATLSISELGEVASQGSGYADLSAPPSFGSARLAAGFTPDPYTASLRSGGAVSAAGVADGCSGYIATAPDYRLEYDAGSLPLLLSVDADADTTLVVNDPGGNWHCDDDSGQGTNPALRFEKPLGGRYDIWVGTYANGSFEDAILSISELSSN